MRLAAALGLAAALALTSPASAQIEPFLSGNVVKIGVLTDMSSIYADIGGPGSVEAARMAIADFGGSVNGKKIELVSADHHNKPDLGPLDLRYSCIGERHRHGGRQSGRRHLVLHHRRLRFWPRARTRHDESGRSEWR